MIDTSQVERELPPENSGAEITEGDNVMVWVGHDESLCSPSFSGFLFVSPLPCL